jgi:hypothetical protein
MAITAKPGQMIRVKITQSISRDSARKTIERLFMKDKAVSRPLDARSANFKPLPKRRGGRIWTKWPSKLHPALAKGDGATIKATPQAIMDLNSVATFVEISAA